MSDCVPLDHNSCGDGLSSMMGHGMLIVVHIIVTVRLMLFCVRICVGCVLL